MDNMTRPLPPDLSEGCFNCGAGKKEILMSQLHASASVALCSRCFGKPLIDTQPFNARLQKVNHAN